jgi:hypothetical protein
MALVHTEIAFTPDTAVAAALVIFVTGFMLGLLPCHRMRRRTAKKRGWGTVSTSPRKNPKRELALICVNDWWGRWELDERCRRCCRQLDRDEVLGLAPLCAPPRTLWSGALFRAARRRIDLGRDDGSDPRP